VGDPQIIRWAVVAGVLIVVVAVTRFLIRRAMTAEDRKAYKKLRQALDAGDLRRAGDVQLSRGLYVEAARIYERAGEWLRAARAYQKHGDAKKAAECDEKAKPKPPPDPIGSADTARPQALPPTVTPTAAPPNAPAATAVARSKAGVIAAPPSNEASRFELLGELGRGGMGIVYRARDRRLDRLVALKFLPDDMEDDATLVKVFRREARAAAALTHAGIVTVYDVGTLEGREFIAMEMVEGTTLDRVLAEKGPLPVRQAVEIFDKVLDAVAAAHERGVIHRDLKPGNIMRTKSGIKVMDFGLAKLVSGPRTSKQNTIIGGTPGYMPPEQMTGEADHRADVFAAGATFYELLTGKLPGKDGAPASMATGYATPHELVPAVPERLSAVIMRCLEHDVAKRVQDVASMQRELRAVRGALDDIERELQAFLSESVR
jgi:predicted Ser/Thr protein kinase